MHDRGVVLLHSILDSAATLLCHLQQHECRQNTTQHQQQVSMLASPSCPTCSPAGGAATEYPQLGQGERGPRFEPQAWIYATRFQC